MFSKRAQEGYFLLDNRVNPGLPDDAVRLAGLPPGAGRGLFEAPTVTCSHCQTVLFINPARTRDRAYCAKCDHYVCDTCGGVLAQTGVCKTFKQIIEEVQEAATKKSESPSIIIP